MDPYQVAIVQDTIDREFRRWLVERGWELFPIPNGSRDGQPVLDAEDDLPTYGVRREGT